MKNALIGGVLALLLALAPATPAQAQDGDNGAEGDGSGWSLPELPDLPKPWEDDAFFGRDLKIQWGGWYRHSTFAFDDFVRDRTLHTDEFRLYTDIKYDDVHQVYARTRLAWDNWADDDAFDGDDDEFHGPDLDQGFYNLDVSGALAKYHQVDLPFASEIQIGRQFMQIGSGLVYNQVHDGAQAAVEYAGSRLRFLYGRTPASQNDVDRSKPASDRSDRRFWGLEARTRVMGGRHEPYAFIMRMKDYRTPITQQAVGVVPQEYDFDAWYYGVGSTGEVLPTVRYHTEWVAQTGERFASGQTKFNSFFTSAADTGPEDIRAWATVSGLEWFPRVRTRPRVFADFMYGSGDDDVTIVTNSLGGNTAGTEQTNFLGFGFVDTGFSLSPRLSNIYLLKLGADFNPFSGQRKYGLDTLNMGMAYYWYWRPRDGGGISDLNASVTGHHNVAQELDLYIFWRVFSDLAVSTRWGMLFPGDSFVHHEVQHFVSFSLTYSF